MRILVCIKQVPGTTKVDLDPETGVLKRTGVSSKMNPYDLYAVEAAMQIKENHPQASVDVLTMGPPQAEAILREAYMMGVDHAVLMTDRAFAGADVLATATTLAEGIKHLGGYDLIICGKQTTDGDTAQVGSELAELLSITHQSDVSKISMIDNEGLSLEVEYPEAIHKLYVNFPLLLTVSKGINSPRLPSYRKKLLTATKPIQTLTIADLPESQVSFFGLDGSPTQVDRVFPPQVKKERFLWQEEPEILAKQLVTALRQRKTID